jgi:hypothetical protein
VLLLSHPRPAEPRALFQSPRRRRAPPPAHSPVLPFPSFRSGVNLGGWLLLERGPSAPFYESNGIPGDTGEWDATLALCGSHGAAHAQRVISYHRRKHVTEVDLAEIAARGFNAVRIPFGYWIVTGPTAGDPYVGPSLEMLDDAVRWARQHHLQVRGFSGKAGRVGKAELAYLQPCARHFCACARTPHCSISRQSGGQTEPAPCHLNYSCCDPIFLFIIGAAGPARQVRFFY